MLGGTSDSYKKSTFSPNPEKKKSTFSKTDSVNKKLGEGSGKFGSGGMTAGVLGSITGTNLDEEKLLSDSESFSDNNRKGSESIDMPFD
jgi:hypothetical protein